jgi:hypothetical protein
MLLLIVKKFEPASGTNVEATVVQKLNQCDVHGGVVLSAVLELFGPFLSR